MVSRRGFSGFGCYTDMMELPIKEIGSEIGLALVVIYLLVKEFLATKKADESEGKSNGNGGFKQTIDAFYARQILESAITKLSENMVRQTDILERLETDHRDTVKIINKIDSRVEELVTSYRPNL